MALRRGYVYYGRTDKRRPVLVISANVRNELATDVLVIPCSTTLSTLSTHVRLRRGEGGLARPSVVKCEQLTNIRKSEIDDASLGLPLSPARIREVEAAVMRAIGILLPLAG